MEDEELLETIRRARKQVPVPENDGNPSFSMPGYRHSSFDHSLNGKENGGQRSTSTNGDALVEASVYQWAEKRLRSSGSKQDRTLMAVRDAARILVRKGKDPGTTPFYVSLSIRVGWNLNPRQFSEGLKELERSCDIVVTDRRKGRHARMTLG